MEILAASYQNIGPLCDMALTVFFLQGKYLINAPIGTGKSFLFFDGPLYGLYKYAERKLLNNLSKQGYIKIFFKQYDNYYLVVRYLTPGKTKDSCASEFFQVENFDNEVLKGYGSLVQDTDIQKVLKNRGVQLTALPYKNENDLNSGVADILPPREVFVNTMFLVQDSGNIFELTPANRLLVLKNVFGLLGVDEMKDTIAGIKRDIQTEKKIYSNTDSADAKLKQLLTSLVSLIRASGQYIDISDYQEALQDLELVADKVNIEKFSLDEEWDDLYASLSAHVNTLSVQYTSVKTQLDTITDQITTQKKFQEQYIQQIATSKSQISELEQKIQQGDTKQLENLKQQKQSLQKNLSQFGAGEDIEKLLTFYKEHPDLLSDITLQNDFSDYRMIVQTLIEQGKLLKVSCSSAESELKNLVTAQQRSQEQLAEFDIKKQGTKYEILYQQAIEKLKTTYTQQYKELDFQLQNLEKEQQQLEECMASTQLAIEKYRKILEEKLPFYTHYLSEDTFDEEIKKSTYVDIQEELEQQLQQKEKFMQSSGLSEVLEKIKHMKQKREKVSTLLEQVNTDPDSLLVDFFEKLESDKFTLQQQNSPELWDKKKQGIEQKLAYYKKQLDLISGLFSKIDWKKILEQYQKYLDMQKQLKTLDTTISEKEQLVQQFQEYKEQVANLRVRMQEYEHQKNLVIDQLADLEQKKFIFTQQLAQLDTRKLQEAHTVVREFDNTLHTLKNLLSDFGNTLLKIKKLQRDEVLSKNLYTIFSRDLLLFVLEDNLPVLNEIINNFLSGIVTFQVDMRLVQKGSNLELETIIIDERGERETRSLSGGQKVVLRLVWMLSVAVYLRSTMLFLDETINNLDKDAIAKVAELLKNFVQQNELKMYVVTHSAEIKMMNIWDGIINLDQELS